MSIPNLRFHELGEPWPETGRWMRVLYHPKGARTPVSHIASALNMHKKDIGHVLEVEKIPLVSFKGYVERSVLITDLSQLLKSPLLKLNWSADQIRQAVSYFDKNLGHRQDKGASYHYTTSTGRYSVRPRLVRDDDDDDDDGEEVASASLEALATEAAMQPSLKRNADELEEWEVSAVYPKEWAALLSDQRDSIHNLAMAAFRGHPDYEKMKKAKIQELEDGLYEEMRPDEMRAMTSKAKREAVAEIMRERSAEITAHRQEVTNGALFSFHLPGK